MDSRSSMHYVYFLGRLQMQRIETTLGIQELARPLIEKILSHELKYGNTNDNHPLFACLVICLITQIFRASGESGELFEDYWKYMNKCWNVRGYWHRLGNEMVAIKGLYSVMQLRNIRGSTVEAAIEEVRSRLLMKPVFLNVRRSMLKWSRIQNHLQADDDDDDAQLAKYITQGPTPAINNLRKRNMELQY